MDRRADVLLLAGIAGGPLFLVSSALHGSLRDGFSFLEHPPSSLASGDPGWVHVATFILSGLLLVVGAAGLRIALRGPGAPEALSWHGLVHGAVFAVGFTSLVVACVVFAWRSKRHGAPGKQWISLACGAASLALSASPNVGDPEGRFLLLWLAVAVSLGWASAILIDVRRQISAGPVHPIEEGGTWRRPPQTTSTAPPSRSPR